MPKFFETPEEANFEYVLTTTGLSGMSACVSLLCYGSLECILATVLSRSGHRVLHIDSSDSYGGTESSLGYSQLLAHLQSGSYEDVEVFTSESEYLKSVDRQLSIDVCIPRLLFSRSFGVDFLVGHQVSKYLSFLSVKELSIGDWVFPTSRGGVFADKFLKLPEKRSLMNLLKCVGTSNVAIHSTATVCSSTVDSTMPLADDGELAVNFLRDKFQIHREELLHAIIHGMCLFPDLASKMLATTLVENLTRFVSSLTAFGDGCPLLVPMYGNSDIVQSFARAAAVQGAMYILNCSLKTIQPELPITSKVIQTQIPNPERVLHAVVFIKNSSEFPRLKIFANDVDPPVFALSLTNGVCPEGSTLIHFFQVNPQTRTRMNEIVETYASDAIFHIQYTHNDNIGGIDSAIHTAKSVYNLIFQLPDETQLPLPAEETTPLDDTV